MNLSWQHTVTGWLPLSGPQRMRGGKEAWDWVETALHLCFSKQHMGSFSCLWIEELTVQIDQFLGVGRCRAKNFHQLPNKLDSFVDAFPLPKWGGEVVKYKCGKSTEQTGSLTAVLKPLRWRKWRLCQFGEGAGKQARLYWACPQLARATGWRMNLIRCDLTAFNRREGKIELKFPRVRVICCRNHQCWRCFLVSLRMWDMIEVFDFFFFFPYPRRHWTSHLNSEPVSTVK